MTLKNDKNPIAVALDNVIGAAQTIGSSQIC